jgi:hypothetical protein
VRFFAHRVRVDLEKTKQQQNKTNKNHTTFLTVFLLFVIPLDGCDRSQSIFLIVFLLVASLQIG